LRRTEFWGLGKGDFHLNLSKKAAFTGLPLRRFVPLFSGWDKTVLHGINCRNTVFNKEAILLSLRPYYFVLFFLYQD
jgi:hypothetical protein